MNKTGNSLLRLTITVLVGGAVLFVSLAFSIVLIARREPPPQVTPAESSLTVEVARMAPEDVPMVIVGHGEAVSVEVTPVSPEIAGNVTRIHERLFVGEVIPAGETLFEIDPTDYQVGATQAQAQLAQAHSSLEALRVQYISDRNRLETLGRNRDLARNEFHRVRDLFETEAVGALANVERTELAYNQARDTHDLMTQNVTLYPMRIADAEHGVAAAEAALQLAETNLERTAIKTHYDARIQEKRVEQGQYVSPGASVLTLVNDSILEIIVPLDSRDARDALRFLETTPDSPESSWFGALEQIDCRIFWTEAPDSHYWTGRLDRILAFNQNTRTITAAIRIEAAEARSTPPRLPLVAGMFCRVEIPGRIMEQVYRLPRWSVTFENEVFVVENGRLMPRAVKVLRTQRDQAFIYAGLYLDDLVIVTRLVNPLPNTRVEYAADAISISTRQELLGDGAQGEDAL